MTSQVDDARSHIGHQFPGGAYRIAHWENWLLTDCTGAEPLPDKLVHPIALFHAPILGSGISITELFALFNVTGMGGVSLVGYDWEYFQPLQEDVDYQCDGRVITVERGDTTPTGWTETMAFQIDMLDHDHQPVARVTNTWRFHRQVS